MNISGKSSARVLSQRCGYALGKTPFSENHVPILIQEYPGILNPFSDSLGD